MDNGETVIPGTGRRIQVRKVREGGFTEAKKQIVLDHLAACSNIRRAAKAAGISAETVNYHRRRDPAFRQQVIEAIEAGYDALEAMVIDHAATGGHYLPGDTKVDVVFDPEVALHLLKLRRLPIGRRTGQAGQAPRRASEKELNEAILAKLDVLARRQGPKDSGSFAGRKKDSPSTSSGRTDSRIGAGSGPGPRQAQSTPQDERAR